MRARFKRAFQSLGVANYRLFTFGQIIKVVGVWLQFIAQDWLVLELTNDSAAALGVTTALQFAPVLVLSLYGGRLADRYDKRSLLIGAHAAFSLLALVMGILIAAGAVTLYVVFAFAACFGAVQAIETPVRQAFVSELVPPVLLPNALGLSSATYNTARVAGPALAGVAIAAFGLSPVFLLNALTYLGPLFFLIRMNPAELYRERKQAAPDARIRDGLVYIWRREDLMMPLVLLFAVGLIGFNFEVLLAVLAKTVFGTGAASFGLFSSALAFGALFGALVSGTRRARPSAYTVAGAAMTFGALQALTGFAPTFVTATAMLVPTGFCMIFLVQAANQRLQLGVDAEFRGRVMSVFVFVFLGTYPVGAPLIGLISEHYGPRVGMWVAGGGSLAAGLVALVWQSRRSRRGLPVRVSPPLATAPTPETTMPR